MHNNRYCKTILTALALFFIASPGVAKKLEDRPWIEVRSENFRIYSVWEEDQTVELVRNLELLRAAIPVLTSAESTEAPIPTEIFAIKNKTDFMRFGVTSSVVGIFKPGLRRNLIVLRRSAYLDGQSVILHEYSHFVLRNHGAAQYPEWYDEGFAEYFSSARLRDGQFDVGLFPQDRRLAFKNCEWVHIRRLISYEPGGRAPGCLTYPQSWALVHYLQTLPGYSENLSGYLGLIESGKDRRESFEAAFGMTAGQLDRDLRAYLRRGEFRYISLPADGLLPDFRPEVVAMSRELAALKLAGVALAYGRANQAKKWYSIASGADEFQAQVESGMGDVYRLKGDFESALGHFERAVALAPDDALIQLDMGEYWHGRALAVRKEAEQARRDDYLEKARAHYVKAWKIDDALPEVYAMYGDTFVLQGNFEKAIEPLETAFLQLPSSIDIRISLAEAYLGAGRAANAATLARSVLAWTHGESAPAERAQALLEFLQSAAAEATSRQ